MVVAAVASLAFPRTVVAVLEMRKPSPFARAHLIPALDDPQTNGLRVIDWPYPRVGVFSPALERHWTPVHSVRLPSFISVTDFGGVMVRHSVEVIALGPKFESISQLMFFDGE